MTCNTDSKRTSIWYCLGIISVTKAHLNHRCSVLNTWITIHTNRICFQGNPKSTFKMRPKMRGSFLNSNLTIYKSEYHVTKLNSMGNCKVVLVLVPRFLFSMLNRLNWERRTVSYQQINFVRLGIHGLGIMSSDESCAWIIFKRI